MAAARKITPLTKQAAAGTREVLAIVTAERRKIAARIRGLTQLASLSISARERERLYAQIAAINSDIATKLDGWMEDMIWEIAPAWHDQAIADIRRDGIKPDSGILKFDKLRAETYLRMIHPDNSQQLAAVYTQNMTKADIGSLRQSVVEVFRQSSVSNMTAADVNKALQTKWNDIAGGIEFDRFVDAGGKRWDNARYFQMLVRTTDARVARESYNDTLAANGDDLIQIVNVGDSCPWCETWDGVIVSISGANEKFPSYQEAIDGGMFHPNCDCLSRRVDDDIDKDNIAAQSQIQNPDIAAAETKTEALEAVSAYKAKIEAADAAATRDARTLQARAGKPA